jgi:hypothetical protein
MAETATTVAHDARRAQVLPLLEEGLSIRAISAQTGIPTSAIFRIKARVDRAARSAPAAPSQPVPGSPAVHRAKRQIERATTMSHTEPTSQEPTSTSPQPPAEPVELPSPQPTSEVDPPAEPGELPPSYITTRTLNGIPHAVRRLTIEVFEHRVTEMIDRGLLRLDQAGDPATVLSALFAMCFTDDALDWLCRHGYLEPDQRGQTQAIARAVNQVISQPPR